MFESIKQQHNVDTNIYTISIFGEWVGKGIQKSVAIAQLEKAMFIFGVKISKPGDETFNAYWVDSANIKSPEHKIYNIEDYKTYSIDIDFNMPQLVQNTIIDMTIEVENECPVSKEFGVSGVGEGIVFACTYKDVVYRFKSKGEKHSVSKVTKLASVDTEKLNSITEFVTYAVTENRFNQAIEKVFEKRENMDLKKMGDFLKWMVNDIMKEELDTMIANKLEPKDVNKYISSKSREMFMQAYNNTTNPIN